MPTVLAIDPGPTESAYVLFDGRVVEFGKRENSELLRPLVTGFDGRADRFAIEMVASFGMAVGAEVFETVLWTGRFVQQWGGDWQRVYRKEVKMHLCNSMRAKDANIRQALIDKFGGSAAIGKKKSPGPLFGIAGDVWSALSIAVTYSETMASQTEAIAILDDSEKDACR